VEEDLAEGYHEMDARELRKLSPVSSVCFEILEIIVVTFVLYTNVISTIMWLLTILLKNTLVGSR
jgi:hypothetical protein